MQPETWNGFCGAASGGRRRVARRAAMFGSLAWNGGSGCGRGQRTKVNGRGLRVGIGDLKNILYMKLISMIMNKMLFLKTFNLVGKVNIT